MPGTYPVGASVELNCLAASRCDRQRDRETERQRDRETEREGLAKVSK